MIPKKATMRWTVLIAGALSTSLATAADTEAPSSEVLRKFSRFDRVIDAAVADARRTRMSDPLKFISQDMKSIVGDLGALKTDKPVQVKEQKVVAQLEELIKELEKACSGGGGGSLNPSRPMADSQLGGGPGGINELTDPKASEKQWGGLSPKQREQILQSKTEGFPPGYEALLQSYYKRLAAEQVTGEPTGEPAPASGE